MTAEIPQQDAPTELAGPDDAEHSGHWPQDWFRDFAGAADDADPHVARQVRRARHRARPVSDSVASWLFALVLLAALAVLACGALLLAQRTGLTTWPRR